ALWVMAFHLNALAGPREISLLGVELHPLITVGWVGVQVFFVLSGFLLTTHLVQAGSTRGVDAALPGYFLARVRRVFPAYWAQILVLIALHVAMAGALPPWIGHVPIHLPMLQNFSEPASHAINGVYWTLPIEFAFYLVLPLIVRLLLRL